MTPWLSEFRNALFGIAKRPAFPALVVVVLGAGLACVIFMLALIDGFMLRPLPFARPEQLLQAGFHGDGGLGDVFPVTRKDFVEIRRQLAADADVAGVARSTISLGDLGQPERTNGAHASANLFRVLGVAPLIGRDFSSDDERPGAPAVAMLSWSLWQSRYGGDPAVVGRQIRVDAKPTTVVGVMPKDFSYPRTETIWVPAVLPDGAQADEYAYWIVLRRHPQVGDAAIANALETWFADAARADPERFRGESPQVEPLARMTIDRTTRAVLGLLVAAVVMVLLVACANAANLLLTRTLARSHELSVRVALGASRTRLIAHLLAESLILSLMAAGLGLLIAHLGLGWQLGMMRESEYFPRWLHFGIDLRVAVLAVGAALFTALATGILPALRAGDLADSSGLREGTRSIGGGSFARASRILVVGEIALSCALLICVGTLVHGIDALDRSDLGIDTNHLLTARVALPKEAWPTSTDQLRLYQRLGERLRQDPGVTDATVGTALPGTFYNEAHDIASAGTSPPADATLPQVYSGAVDGHFLGAYGVALQQGRFFDSRDSADNPRVAVVDRTFVERFGEGGAVIGRQFRLDPRDPKGATVTVVGVIGKLTLDIPGFAAQPAMLVPLSQNPFRIASIAVRTRGEPLRFAQRLNELMREVDADTPLYWVRDYADVIRSTTVGERTVAKNFAAFGSIALVLAAVGLYGVVAFTVGRRTREIGVRRALGASGSQVLHGVLGRSLAQLGIGLAIGVVAGFAFSRMLTASMGNIAPSPFFAIPGTLIVLAATTFIALMVPAWRALRIDPMVALRDE